MVSDPSLPTDIIMFDVGGVLAGDTYNVLLESLFEQCDPFWEADEKQLAVEVMQLARDLFAQYKVDEDMGEDRFWDGLLEEQRHGSVWGRIFEVVAPLHTSQQDRRQYLKKALRERCFQCYDDVLEVARRLKSRRYLVGILSNHAREWYTELSAQYGLDDVCTCRDMACVSYQRDIRSGKPDPQCFKAMLRRVGNVPAVRQRLQLHEGKHDDVSQIVAPHVVFIDDKLCNTEAAHDQGMRATQFLYDKKRSNVDELIDKLEAMGIHASRI